MKHKFLIFSCILLLFACKKEKIDDPNFVGNWVLLKGAYENTNRDIYLKQTSCNDDLVFSTPSFGKVTLEIKSDGSFVFDSNYGSEKLKLVSKTKRTTSITNIRYNLSCGGLPSEEYSVEGYDVILKNKKGVKIEFPLFYVSEIDRLITVPWVIGVQYFTNNRIYSASGSDPFNVYFDNSMGTYSQTLGNFKRL